MTTKEIMGKPGTHVFRAVGAALMLITLLPPTLADDYPTKPVRLILGFPPGGTNDIIARLVGQKMTGRFKQTVVVDNRPGASGEIAAAAVAKATPDGYTLMLGSNGALTVSPTAKPNLPYDPRKDFEAVAMLASGPMLLVVGPRVKAQNVTELIAAARANSVQLSFASSGLGAAPHLSAELFRTMAGIEMLHVPYKGAGPVYTDLIGGQIDVYFASMASALPLVRSGKIRALGITSASRSSAAPEIPAIGESLRGYSTQMWYALFAPAGTPRSIVTLLHDTAVGVMRSPDVRANLATQGVELFELSPRELQTYVNDEIVKWAKVIKQTGIRIE
jgi:tripartite-type tricarboxylate transporter receptor subunit TctC